MKHVRESLSQFNDYKFFRLFEEDNKKELQDKEKDGLAVIDKIQKNFEDFKKSAKGEILKYKEFWEENKKAKEAVSETGEVYKLYDSDYVVGVLELPVETLSDGSIDGGFGATDEPEEEIIEGKEVSEAEEGEEDLNLDLEIGDEPAPEGDADLNLSDSPSSEGGDLESPDATNMDAIPTETPEETPAEDAAAPEESTPDLTAPQKYFVVYDMSGDEREEILRTGSNNVANAFAEFYNDVFKGTMKSVILQYKEQKEAEKAEAEKKEKQKVQKDKQSKLSKFLGNSSSEKKEEKKENKKEEKKEDKKTNESLNELKLKDSTPKITVIKGRVGRKEVTQYLYKGKDSGLSHYYVEGEKGAKVGIVKFSEIYSEQSKNYDKKTNESLNEYHIPFEETKLGERYLDSVVDELQELGMTFKEADDFAGTEYDFIEQCFINDISPEECALRIKDNNSYHSDDIDESLNEDSFDEEQFLEDDDESENSVIYEVSDILISKYNLMIDDAVNLVENHDEEIMDMIDTNYSLEEIADEMMDSYGY